MYEFVVLFRHTRPQQVLHRDDAQERRGSSSSLRSPPPSTATSCARARTAMLKPVIVLRRLVLAKAATRCSRTSTPPTTICLPPKDKNRQSGCAAPLRQSRRPRQGLAHCGFGAHRGAGEEDDLGRHKVARKHPVTGRTALYSVSGSSFGIEGMPEDEALDLLDELKRHATQEKYQLRLKYGWATW